MLEAEKLLAAPGRFHVRLGDRDYDKVGLGLRSGLRIIFEKE